MASESSEVSSGKHGFECQSLMVNFDLLHLDSANRVMTPKNQKYLKFWNDLLT